MLPPRGFLKQPNHLVELLCLLRVPGTDDRGESFKHNPADAHVARPRFSKSAQSFGRTAAPAVGSNARRWRESFKHNPADVGSKARRSEREF